PEQREPPEQRGSEQAGTGGPLVANDRTELALADGRTEIPALAPLGVFSHIPPPPLAPSIMPSGSDWVGMRSAPAPGRASNATPAAGVSARDAGSPPPPVSRTGRVARLAALPDGRRAARLAPETRRTPGLMTPQARHAAPVSTRPERGR